MAGATYTGSFIDDMVNTDPPENLTTLGELNDAIREIKKTLQANISGTTSLVTLKQPASITGNLAIASAGNLSVAGNATVTGTLGVTAATTLSNTLAVTGASTLTGAVTMADDLDFTKVGGGTVTGMGSLNVLIHSGDILTYENDILFTI
jgi:hypothetical protein